MIEMTEHALEAITRIAAHLHGLAAAYGKDSQRYQQTAASFGTAMTSVLQLLAKGGRLLADNDTGLLSLGVSTSYGLYVGVVFFPDEEYRDARDAQDPTHATVCAHHGTPWPQARTKPCPAAARDSHDYCYAISLPTPGTWSLHS